MARKLVWSRVKLRKIQAKRIAQENAQKVKPPRIIFSKTG